MHYVALYLLGETRIHILDNVVSMRSYANDDSFTFNYKWVDYNMLSMVCTRELIYVEKAQPIYNQVTLERSDFRTDFRTRLKNKEFAMTISTKVILTQHPHLYWCEMVS